MNAANVHSIRNYTIANEGSDRRSLTFRAHTAGGRGRWTNRIEQADRYRMLDDARTALDHLEAHKPARAGRRFIVAEIAEPNGPTFVEIKF